MTSTRSRTRRMLVLLGLWADLVIASPESDPWVRPLPIFRDRVHVATPWVDAAQAQSLQRDPEQTSGLTWIPLAAEHAPASAQLSVQVAVVQTADGLIVLGRAGDDADTGEWTLQWSTLLSLPLQQIGWQRIQSPLDSDAQCDRLGLSPADREACPGWRAAQLKHRERLRQAFRPEWRLVGGSAKATPQPDWSAPAYGFDLVEPAPPGPHTLHESADGHRFALALPWPSWPLAPLGVLRHVYLQARYCRTDGACVSAPAAAGTALALELARPLTIEADDCGQSPADATDSPWYVRIAGSLLPAESASSTTAYLFRNPGGGYLDRPDPDRTSPELAEFRFETRPLTAGTWLCLPEMRLWRPPQASVPASTLSDDQIREVAAGEWPDPASWPGRRHPYWQDHTPVYTSTGSVDIDAGFTERTLDDGRRLLVETYRVDPPRSGEGMNGACDTARFAVWILRPGADSLRLAVSIGGYGPDLCAGSGLEHAALSADGRSVDSTRVSDSTENLDPAQLARYEAGETIRIRERYCLDDETDSYLPCGRRLSVEPNDNPP